MVLRKSGQRPNSLIWLEYASSGCQRYNYSVDILNSITCFYLQWAEGHFEIRDSPFHCFALKIRTTSKLIGIIQKQNHGRYFLAQRPHTLIYLPPPCIFFPFLPLHCFDDLEPEKEPQGILFSSGCTLCLPAVSFLLHKGHPEIEK